MSPERRRLLAGLLLGGTLLVGGRGRAHAADRRRADTQRLIVEGRKLLQLGDGAGAERAFDDAMLTDHAVDIEIGLVQARLLQGHYQRALAFAAHLAGVHGDEWEGPVMYAWLLALGGQPAIALKHVADARRRAPAQLGLLDFERLLQAGPVPLPLQARQDPVPLAPPGDSLPGIVKATAVALAPERLVAPASAVDAADMLRLVSPMGHTRKARVIARLHALDLAVLQPERPLDDLPRLAWARRDPFPGAPTALLAFARGERARAWPWMSLGFTGAVEDGGLRRTGLGERAAEGGLCCDVAGSLTGVATVDAKGRDRLVPANALAQALAETGLSFVEPAPADPGASGRRLPPDALYERGLGRVWQLRRG